jgi:hypothetical protein
VAAGAEGGAAGEHGDVVGQGDGETGVGAGVVGPGTLGAEPVQGGQALGAEGGDRIGAQAVDADEDHVANLLRRRERQ